MNERQAAHAHSPTLTSQHARSRRMQIALALGIGIILIAWLVGGAIIFLQRQTADAASRQNAHLANNEQLQAELKWMTDFYHDWAMLLGEMDGRSRVDSHVFTWNEMLELAERATPSPPLKDFWGRPVEPWVISGQIIGVRSTGENGAWEDGANDDLVISVKGEYLKISKTNYAHQLEMKRLKMKTLNPR